MDAIIWGGSATKRKHLLIIGDSITNEPGGYAYQLQAKYTSRFSTTIIAADGQSTPWMLSQALSVPKYNGLILLGGINDLYSGLGLSSIYSNVSAIISDAQTKGAKICIVTFPKSKGFFAWNTAIGNDTNTANAWYLARPAPIKAIDFANAISKVDVSVETSDSVRPISYRVVSEYESDPAYVKPDMLHPNTSGHIVLRSMIEKSFIPYFLQ